MNTVYTSEYRGVDYPGMPEANPTDECLQFLLGRTVTIPEFEYKKDGVLSNKYKVFQVVSQNKGVTETVSRRFKDFEWINEKLEIIFYGHILPKLPEKSFMAKFNLDGDAYIKKRMRLLERYLNKMLQVPRFASCSLLKDFLTRSTTDFKVFQESYKLSEPDQDILKINTLQEIKENFASRRAL